MIPRSSPLWRAWAAGVFEARITIPRNGAILRMETTDYELLQNFTARVGVGSLTNRGKKKNPPSIHDIWVYQTTNLDDARTLCLFVAPLLGNRASKKVADLVHKIETNPHWQKQNPEKAASCVVTSHAEDAEAPTASQSTTTDTATASPTVETTG